MTCEEFRSHLAAGNPPAEAAAHAELCADCRNLASTEAELRQAFEVVRDTAPDVPAPLDDAVLTTYRQQLTLQRHAGSRWSLSRCAWTAVATALIVMFVLHVYRMPAPINPTGISGVTPLPAPASKQPEVIADKRSANPVEHARKRVPDKRRGRYKREESRVDLSASETPETGFQNLMYCDQLSCSGAMQVFRIQLPVSDVEPFAAPRSSSGLVQADVVVGSDGVARAIRIVN